MKKKMLYLLIFFAAITVCITVMAVISNAAVSDEGLLPFEDIKSGDWYEESAKFCYTNDIIDGMNYYSFAPNQTLTRAQFVTMLANVENVDTSGFTTDQFVDVKPSHWYSGAVAWAYENEIVSGTSENMFSPNLSMNRQTFARIMANYMKGKGYEVILNDTALDKFTDRSQTADWAIEEMKYVVSAGLITGMNETTVAPLGNVVRAQAARILMVFLQEYYYDFCEHSFTTATCTAPSVCTECGMIIAMPNGHSVPDDYSCTKGGTCDVCLTDVPKSRLLHSFEPANCGLARHCRCGVTRGSATNKHNWLPATCRSPKTCAVCNKKEGGIGDHSWKAATCRAPKTCKYCNLTEGKIGDHEYTVANCYYGSKCIYCGLVKSEPLGHDYTGVGCNEPRKCINCGVVTADVLGHKFVGKNNCERCNAASPYATLVYYTKQKGEYDSSTSLFTYFTDVYTQNNYFYVTMLTYSVNEAKYGIVQCTYHPNGDLDATCLVLDGVNNTYRCEYEYVNYEGDIVFEGVYYINPAKVPSTISSFYSYNGNSRNVSTARKNTSQQLNSLLKQANSLFSGVCLVKISDFGFTDF